jgi:DNA-binding CsgD family transcriptional regulator
MASSAKTLLMPAATLDLDWRRRLHINTTQGLRNHIIALENEVSRLRKLVNTKKQTLELLDGLSRRLDIAEVGIMKIRKEFAELKGLAYQFSPTELRVYECLKLNKDKPHKQLAPMLDMALRTFRFHTSNMARKAGVSRIAELT